MVKRFQFVGYMLMWLCAAPVMAQQGTSTALQVPALIPSDAVGFLTVRPQLLAQHEALKLMPLELVTAAGLDTFGVDPLAIERIDVIFGKPSRGDEPMAAVVTSAVDITPEQITAGLLAPKGAKEEAGIKMYALAKVPDGVAAFVNKRQIVVGPRPFVLQLLTSKAADGELRRQVARMNQADHVSLVIALSPMRELLVEGSGLGDIPRAVQSDIRVLTEKVQVVAARLRLGAEPPVAVAIEAASQADIAAVQSSWNHLVQVATAETMGQAERRIANKNSPSARAAIAYAQRYLAEVARRLTPTRVENRLVLRADTSMFHLIEGGAVFSGMLPGLEAAARIRRQNSPRPATEPQSNLSAMGQAMHRHLQTYKRLPIAGDTNQDGKKQLSWRVQILPFVGESELFKEFHHDEPWDSPHNIRLLERMPAIFQHPDSSAAPGNTVYQMPVGPDLVGELGKSVRFQDIPDGLSNTVIIVVTTDQAAVPWTKPQDINPIDNLEALRKQDEHYTVLMCDGAVQWVDAKAPPETLKALFTRDGGEIVSGVLQGRPNR